MKKYSKFIVIFLAAVFFVSYGYAAGDINSGLKVAPGFQLKGLEGKAASLSDYLGKKPVVLVFWTTWCPYCRAQLKQLNDRLPELTKKGIQILTIDVGEPKNKIEDFVKSRSINLQVLMDESSKVADMYELMGVPTYFVIDLSGKIVTTDNQFPEDAVNKLAVK